MIGVQIILARLYPKLKAWLSLYGKNFFPVTDYW